MPANSNVNPSAASDSICRLGIENFKRYLSAERLIWLACLVLLAWLVLIPLGMLFLASFKSTEGHLPLDPGPFTFENYINVFTAPITYRLLLISVIQVVGSIFLAAVVACGFAWFLDRTNIPFRTTLLVLLLSPIAVPPAITAMSWTLLGGPSVGLYNVWIRSMFGLSGQGPIDVYSLGGIVFVTAITLVPSFYFIISPVIRSIDTSFEEASEICGVSKWGTFRHITIPLISHALIGAAIFYAIIVLETFEVPAILGMPKRIFVFSTLIYQAVEPDRGGLPDYGTASTYGVLVLLITLVLLWLYWRLVGGGKRFAVITGKGYRPRTIQLKPLGKWLIFTGMSAYLLFVVILPFLILVWVSLLPFYTTPSFSRLSRISLENFAQLMRYPGVSQALVNTIIVFSVAATVTTVIAAVASRMTVRERFAGHAIPDHLTLIVIAVPSVVLALALRLVYASLPIAIYGTIWIIVAACVTRFLSYGTRVMTPAYLQLHPALEEASSASGVSPLNTLRRVQMPLLAPALTSVWLWTAVHSGREIPMSTTLAGANSQTLGVALWQIWTQAGNIGLASSLAVLLTLASAIGTYFVARLVLLKRPLG